MGQSYRRPGGLTPSRDFTATTSSWPPEPISCSVRTLAATRHFRTECFDLRRPPPDSETTDCQRHGSQGAYATRLDAIVYRCPRPYSGLPGLTGVRVVAGIARVAACGLHGDRGRHVRVNGAVIGECSSGFERYRGASAGRDRPVSNSPLSPVAVWATESLLTQVTVVPA